MVRQSCYGLSFALTFTARLLGVGSDSTPQQPRKVEVAAQATPSNQAKQPTAVVEPSTAAKSVSTANPALFRDVPVVGAMTNIVAGAVRFFQHSLHDLIYWAKRALKVTINANTNPHAKPPSHLKTKLKALSEQGGGVFQYAVVTAAYWAFTVSDGAIRMLVLFQFHLLGYTAFQIAALFLFYEIFGVVTNFFGGWIASRWGLKFTLFGGTAMQVVSLLMLAFISPAWSVPFVVTYTMISQALSGIAKDLTKMSAKSAIKAVVPKGADPALYRWVSLLTGSKNALKGVGFFVGALLLTLTGFSASALIMAAGLGAILCVLPKFLPNEIGKAKAGTKLKSMFALDARINILSAARFFLFGARDVWFVVALPVYMTTVLGLSPMIVGAYLALWTIGYGIVQALAPRFIKAKEGATPNGHNVTFWAAVLAVVPAAIALALAAGFPPALSIIGGLAIFGIIFAINSAVHSYMIVHYADSEKVAMTIGFYYMANAGGRLAGTVLSGVVYLATGIQGCLWISSLFLILAALISARLPYSGKPALPDASDKDEAEPPESVLPVTHTPCLT